MQVPLFRFSDILTKCFPQALLAAVITYVWNHLIRSAKTKAPRTEQQPAVLQIRVPIPPQVDTRHSCCSQSLVLLVSDLSPQRYAFSGFDVVSVVRFIGATTYMIVRLFAGE